MSLTPKGKGTKRPAPTASKQPHSLAAPEVFEHAVSQQDLCQELTVIEQPPPPSRPGRLSNQMAKRIFREEGLTAISRAAIEALTHQLNRPWAKGYIHGVWDLHAAAGVILDDAPIALRAEAGHKSKVARQREHGYSLMLEGAQILQNAGVPIPKPGDKPPKTNQAKSMANPNHRDWWLVFCIVKDTLTEAGCKGIGIAPTSPAVNITCQLLNSLGINNVSPEGLIKMLQRKRRV